MKSAKMSTPILRRLNPDEAEESTIYSSAQQSSEDMQEADVVERKDTDESGDNSSIKTQAEPWRLTEEVKDFELNSQAGGRRLGVTWKDLSVRVVPSDERLKENIISQFNLLQLLQDFRQKPALKTILESSTGCVRPGEMLLVLGRPGSGCTTLLKMLANKRKGYVYFS